MLRLIPLLALLCAGGCRPAPASVAVHATVTPDPLSAHVLVVVNGADPDSIALGQYYMSMRAIPGQNLVTVSTATTQDILPEQYADLQSQIRNAIRHLKTPIDYIVLTRGIPLRIRNPYYSVDGHLATMDLKIHAIKALNPDQIKASENPYFGKNEPFSHARFGMYLVTRLDGYSLKDAEALVNNSIGAKPMPGLFFFNGAGTQTHGSYGQLQSLMMQASDVLQAKSFQSKFESGPFRAPNHALAGYVSWGSNDKTFNLGAYRQLRFEPGAIAETFVSTSGRTFHQITGGQSLIADLVHQGVTGVKGYVFEPYTFAMCHPDILFDRYTSGFNLAESFYMASPICRWMDVVVGDPLCRPYGRH